MHPEASKVEGILRRWAAAVHARDLDGVTEAHDPDMLMFDVVGPLQVEGLDRYRATWLDQFFPWHGADGKFELRDLKVCASDAVAFATGLLDCAGTEDGERAQFTLRLTVGLQKRDGQWWIVHEHHSEPLEFDEKRIGVGAQS